MVNIIYPSHTSKSLKKLRENTIHEVGKKGLRKAFVVNVICNVLTILLFLASSVVLAECTCLLYKKANDFFAFLVVLLGLGSLCSGLLAIGAVADLFRGTMVSVTCSYLKKNGCTYPKLLDKSFLKVVDEAERIEVFCDIVKSHPDCVLQETEEYDIRVEYIENKFKKTKMFSSALGSNHERVARNDGLDFSYLDKEIDKYIED